MVLEALLYFAFAAFWWNEIVVSVIVYCQGDLSLEERLRQFGACMMMIVQECELLKVHDSLLKEDHVHMCTFPYTHISVKVNHTTEEALGEHEIFIPVISDKRQRQRMACLIS